MPAKIMKYEHINRAQSAHPKNLFLSSKLKRQLSVSPQRFRFRRFKNIPLGVIHPEQYSSQQAKEKVSLYKVDGPPEYKTYRPGDREFIEVHGKSMKMDNVIPNIIYTDKDKTQLPDHLNNPFIYVQELHQKGRTVEQTALSHPDLFIYFETVAESMRDNLNIKNHDYVKVLKSMNKTDRKEFYRKCIEMNSQFFDFFKKFVKTLKTKGLFQQKKQLSHKSLKLPKKLIFQIAIDHQYIKQDFQITLPHFNALMKQLGYPEKNLDADVQQFFSNVLLGDSPVNHLIQKLPQQQQKISLKAFLYNVQRFLKDKHKLKNIFSKNAAKQRNLQIKASIIPYQGTTWRGFKKIMVFLRVKEDQILHILKQNQNYLQSTQLQNSIDDREKLMKIKRIVSKHLQSDTLKYLLLSEQDIRDTYLNDINKNSNQLQIFKDFLEVFYNKLQGEQFTLDEVLDFLVYSQYPKYEAEQIINFLKKILKTFGNQVQNQTSKYATISSLHAQQETTKKQVDEFVQKYTQKKNFEWYEFKKFIDELREFYQEAIKNVKLKNLESWQWNMVAEWILRRLNKLDKKILIQIQYSLECIDMNLHFNEHKLTYFQLLSQKMIDSLNPSTQFQDNVEIPHTNDDIMFAILEYQSVAVQLKIITSTNQSIEAINTQIISASQLIDNERLIIQNERMRSPKGIEMIPRVIENKQNIKISPTTRDAETQAMIGVKTNIAIRSQRNTTQNSFETNLTDDELDRKIRNAIILQDRCQTTLKEIKYNY